MATVSATYKMLECNDAESTAQQLTRELSYAKDLDALKYKTSAGDFKYFYPGVQEATFNLSDNTIPVYNSTTSALEDSTIEDNDTTVTIDNNLEVQGSTNITENLEVVGNVSANGDIYAENDIYTTTWQSYTPEHFGGFSDTTTSAFKYKEIGDLVFVKYDVFGTGNDVGSDFGTYFSLPVSADEAGVMPIGYAGVNNTPNSDVQAQGLKIRPSNTKIVYVGWDFWGDGNSKEYCGNFWYRKKV